MRNNFRTIGAAAVAGYFATMGVQASAASAGHLEVTISGRPVEAQGDYALKRDGAVFVDLIDVTRALGGVLIFRTAAGAEVALNNKHLIFKTGVKSAMLDTEPISLASVPFVQGTRYYVPLRALAQAAGFHVNVDAEHGIVALAMPVVAVSPTPLASQVVIASAASPATDGLHITATIANLTGAALNVAFPSSERVGFIAVRDGKTLWSSTSGSRAMQTKSTLLFTGNEAKSFAGFWPGFLTVGPGPLTIRTQLLTTPPIFAPDLTVIGPPLPTPSPTPAASAVPSAGASASPAASAPPATPATSASPAPAASAAPSAAPSAGASASPSPSPEPHRRHRHHRHAE